MTITTIQEHDVERVTADRTAGETTSRNPCGNWYFWNDKTGKRIPFMCKCGRCEHEECKTAWHNRRIAIICEMTKKYRLDKFFTLTLDRSLEEKIAWENIAKIWAKMRHRLKRLAKKAGVKLIFVAVLEAHKDGYPHIHGFINLWLEQNIWSSMWCKCGGGNVVWIERVTDLVKVGEYVNKQLEVGRYVGKTQLDNALDHLKKRKRTIWRSHGVYTDFEIEKMSKKEYNDVQERGHWILIKDK